MVYFEYIFAVLMTAIFIWYCNRRAKRIKEHHRCVNVVNNLNFKRAKR